MRAYFARFTSVTLDVQGHAEGIIAGAFMWGLLPRTLSHKLMGKKPQTRVELKEKVERYLRLEEGEAAKQAYLNAMTAPTTKQHHQPTYH